MRPNKNAVFLYGVDVWPVLTTAAAVLLTLVPFVVPMPLWALAVYWLGLLWVRSMAPYAQHNHGHLPAFNSGVLNRAYDVLLGQTTGYPTALWELHHNRGHHRNYLEPDKDVARVYWLKSKKTMSRWMYALRGNLMIVPDSFRIDADEKAAGRKSLRAKLVGELAVMAVLYAAMLAWNWKLALVFVVLQNAVMSWMIWWESYVHHLHAPSTNAYDASVTVEDRAMNWLNFNIGHHTAHHEKPTLHWSLLPARTEQIRAKIHASCLRAKKGPAVVAGAKPAESAAPAVEVGQSAAA